MFRKQFLFTPLDFLSSFHTTMCISHYKWFFIYIVIVSKCIGMVLTKMVSFSIQMDLHPVTTAMFFFLLYQIDKKTQNVSHFIKQPYSEKTAEIC